MYEEYRIGEITMSDRIEYIRRQAVIDALHGYFDGMLETDTWSPCDVYGLIEILPSAQPEQRWIPCSERLPVKKTEVIYTLDNHYVSTGYMTDRDYNGDEMELHWEDMESGALIYPEAWMPLPEPYNGDDK